MTASERLKALDEAALYVTNVQTTDTRAYALAILRDALPELIALVEAVEKTHAICATAGVCEETTQQALRTALIALAAKLKSVT